MSSSKFDIQAIERSLSDINSCFSKILLDTNYHKQENIFSWPNYLFGIFSSLSYVAEYQRLIDRKQYSFLLVDKSFFQFYFKFDDKGQVVAAKLSYFPAPVEISGAVDELQDVAEQSGIDLIEEYYLGVVDWLDRGIDVVNTSHLRMDYDPSARTHSQCHVQFGGINELRIPSRDLVNPFLFFDWICTSIVKRDIEDIVVKKIYKESKRYSVNRIHLVEEFEKGTLRLVGE